MENSLVVVIVTVCVCPSVAAAAPGLPGLGKMAGEPSGLSTRPWPGNHVVPDAAPTCSNPWHGAGVHLRCDLLPAGSLLFSLPGFLPLHVGAGARDSLLLRSAQPGNAGG